MLKLPQDYQVLGGVETLYDGLGPSYLALVWLLPDYSEKMCVVKVDVKWLWIYRITWNAIMVEMEIFFIWVPVLNPNQTTASPTTESL